MARISTNQQSANARERIVETALRLFYRDGLRATGIDKIIAESGVAKMSFYRYFPSKSDLISEFLRRAHADWMTWFTAAVSKKLEKPGRGLEVIADVLGEWFDKPEFRGCAFINTNAEIPDYDAEHNQIVRDHKAELECFIKQTAIELGLSAPKKIASAVVIIIDGTTVRSQMTRDPNAISHCRWLLQMTARAEKPSMSGAASRSKKSPAIRKH